MSLQIFIYLCLISSAPVFSKKGRIIGGQNTDTTDFPYQALLKRISNDQLICGAAIISHFHIITTAHCVDKNIDSHDNIKIIVGNFNSSSYTGITYYPNKIFIHTEYTGNLNPFNTIQNDIAIIQIKGYMEFSKFISKIKLATENIIDGNIGVFVGWGSTYFPNIVHSVFLQKIWVTIINNKKCQDVYPGIYADQFCGIQHRGIGPCFGDGGGPLISVGKLVGLISLSNPCAEGIPDVYTSIYYHLKFIKFILYNVGQSD
ncbi:PREDICTED: chymotrypsin-1-like isoform X2 [Ceratosolen solmsi marchali]|uniref:Chymotrypsin-1-like isoform X2 n=1 Tax=Ceratosolen solmsi marchali TaxID=326594 RepID=A0AAJ7DX44_9HYME|nr:PREDICTED: chymotrypsin-1-like isoform X2 [Ceratosolen solmsi marchali]